MTKYEVEIKPARLGWDYRVSCQDPYFGAFAMLPRPTERWARRAAERVIRRHARTLRKRGPEYTYTVEVGDENSDERDGG